MYKKSQSSLEYLVVIGFTLLLLTPLSIMYLQYSQSSTEKIILEQVNQATSKIANAAQEMSYFGKPSKTTIAINFPNNINNIIIEKKTITFIVKFGDKINEIHKESDIELKGSIKPSKGLHNIIIENKGDYIWITE